MPFKLNQRRRHHIPKQIHKVMNWREYDASLRQRGSLTVWFLAPRSTAYGYFARWDWDGTLGRIHHALYVQCREQAGREASPTAGIIDSQSVKGAEKGGPASIRRATTRARRSRARSAMCSSICKAC